MIGTFPPCFRAAWREHGRQRLMEADGHLLLVLHAPQVPIKRAGALASFARSAGAWQGAPQAEQTFSLVSAWPNIARRSNGSNTRKIRRPVPAKSRAARSTHAAHAGRPQLARRAAKGPRGDAGRAVVDRRPRRSGRRFTTGRLTLSRRQERPRLRHSPAGRSPNRKQPPNDRGRPPAERACRGCFFPIATLTGMFSMGFHHGLEAYNAIWAPWLFIGVTAIGLLMGIIITAIIARPAPQPKDKNSRGT